MSKTLSSSASREADYEVRRDRIKVEVLIHDLKVPLAVIEAGVTSLLSRQDKYGALSPNQEKVLQRILRNARTTKTLVNDVLELGRSRDGIVHLTRLSLSQLIGQTLVELFDLANVNAAEEIRSCNEIRVLKQMLEKQGVILNIDENLWCQELYLDEGKIKQILRNLLSNAMKYRKRLVELEVLKKDARLVLSVRDDGEGIPAVYHNRIFQSYFQMDATECFTVRGHGLGLAGVMVLVEDMNGELVLESDEGKGARFLVELPLADAPY